MTRAQHVLLALALVTAALAGCIGTEEPSGPDSSLNASNATTDPATASNEAANASSTESTDANASREATNATSPANNTTTDPPNEPVDPLPANVTLANATLVERTEDHATFRWNGTAPAQPQRGPHSVTRNLTVPPDRWLAVNATLNWDARTGAHLSVVAIGEERARCFGTPQFRDLGTPPGVKHCESRPQPLDGWSTWELHVGSHIGGPFASGTVTEEPVNFTVTLTVENVGPEGPWGDLDRAPGRPGAWTPAHDAVVRPGVVEWTGSQCTLNVLFESPDGSSVYAASAAHCHSGEAIGIMVHIGGIPNAGRLVYCAWGTEVQGEGQVGCPPWSDENWNTTQENDFALVEIKPSLIDEVNPKLPYWGGPTGMAEPVELGDRLMVYGNSSFRDGDRDSVPDALDPIRAVAVDQTNRSVVMEAPGVIPGDSGGPALDSEGRALGVASVLATPPGNKQAPVEVWYANLPWAVSFMEQHTTLEVDVLTAPLEERPWTMGPGGR